MRKLKDLSFEAIKSIMMFDLNKDDTIRIANDIPEELMDSSEIFLLFEQLFQEIKSQTELKLTPNGNLPVKICKKFYENFLSRGGEDESVYKDKVSREGDWGMLSAAHISLALTDLIKKRSNKYSLTKKGADSKLSRNQLYRAFLKAYFNGYNWGYRDGYPDEVGNYGVGVFIYLLLSSEKKSISFKESLNSLIDLNPQILDFFGNSILWEPEEKLESCVTNRIFFRGLKEAGLVEIEFNKKTKYLRSINTIKKTPLLEATFDLHLEDYKNESIPPMHALGNPMRDTMKVLNKLLATQDFKSEEEMNEFLNANFMGKTPEQIAKEFNLEETDDDKVEHLIEQAYKTDDDSKIEALLDEANELSPNHPEYFLFRARKTVVPEEALKWYEKAMNRCKERLGDDFEKMKGSFWGFHETRPYMTAKAELADTLIHMKYYDEAIQHYVEMLELNPGDNQGIRYVMAPLLLLKKNFGKLTKLFKQYDEDSATFAYVKAYFSFLRTGNSMKSRSLLKKAFRQNEYFPQVVFQIIPFDPNGFDYYSPGQESEAHWMFTTFIPFLSSKNGMKVADFMAGEFRKYFKG